MFLYDTVLDITWLRDGNAGAGSVFDSSVYTTATDGKMNWADATAWASSLTVGAFTEWRLPNMVDTGTPGCNRAYAGTDCGYNVQTMIGATVYSELAHLYFVSLGNKSNYDPSSVAQPDGGLTNTGNFQNPQARDYWFGLPYAPDPTYGWRFGTIDGYQDGAYPGGYEWVYAIAVRPGDVAAVPEPQAAVLMLLGLAAIAAGRIQRRA